MDAAERELLLHLLAKAGGMINTHAPYRIYRRKTKRVRAGRPVYTHYWARWDSGYQAESPQQQIRRYPIT